MEKIKKYVKNFVKKVRHTQSQSKGIKKVFQENRNRKYAVTTVLISDQIDVTQTDQIDVTQK